MNEVRNNRDRFRYELLVDGQVVAFVQYQMRGGRLLLVHTEVDKAHAGQGLASELIKGTLDDIRARNPDAARVFVRRRLHQTTSRVRRSRRPPDVRPTQRRPGLSDWRRKNATTSRGTVGGGEVASRFIVAIP